MSDPITLVVGTAGHIDHGKSALVHALTGTNPDRLPEEQARGMTIELGFAQLSHADCRISFVDVPGHERFIHNMVAGATGIDVAVLVVAADDSVMPQTREHAEVLRLLGMDRCLLVLTKLDLVDDEWAAEVEIEARSMLESLGLDVVSCIWTSVVTGRGLDALKDALATYAHDTHRPRPVYAWFRLPIDRAFVVAGRGTVVTGSVAHGGVGHDDELELWPAGRRVRVRDLQTHAASLDHTGGRMRLGVNLAGLSLEDVARGYELASVGCLEPTRTLDVWLPSLRMPGKTLKQTLRVRLHIATTDVQAEVRLVTRPEAQEVRDVFAQIQTATPVVAAWGQHFILRDEAATRTLGGGRVLRPAARHWTTRHPAQLDGLRDLKDGKPRERLAAIIADRTWEVRSPRRLAAESGLADEQEAERHLRGLADTGAIVQFGSGGQRMWVPRAHLDELSKVLSERLAAHLAANPRLPGVPRTEWPGWMPRACPARFRTPLAEWFVSQGSVVASGEHMVPPGYRGSLSAADQALYDAMLAEFAAGAYQPPGLSELRCRDERNARRVRELIDLALTRGQLVRVADDMWLHADHWRDMVAKVTKVLRSGGSLGVSDIRTMLNSSRKYIVPIAERMDAEGITRRQGDVRVLGPKPPPDADVGSSGG